MHVWVCAWVLSPVRSSVTSWTVAHQAPQSVEFPRQDFWSSCYFLLRGIFPDQRIETPSLASPALAGRFYTSWATRESYSAMHMHVWILPQTLFSSRLPHSTEQTSMSYTRGPCWLSILNIAVCLPGLFSSLKETNSCMVFLVIFVVYWKNVCLCLYSCLLKDLNLGPNELSNY